jgi:hypothetical protein
MPGPDNWEFRFLLHNLSLKKGFESEFMAIVPHDDPRLVRIISKVPAVEPLVRNFTDKFGIRTHPSALIVRRDAPVRVRSEEACVCFRNILALCCVIRCCIIHGYQRLVDAPPNLFCPLYADYFDFYPTGLTADESFLRTLSPALDGADKPDQFRGQISPGLFNPGHLEFVPDGMLLPPLLQVWIKEFARAKSSGWRTRVLFRSLEMAYQASSMPTKNRSTIYDFGAHVGLWVSAFEVLVRPWGKRQRADIEKVTSLLGKASWQNRRLRGHAYVMLLQGNKKVRVNLIQKLYRNLYDARNAFMHGNPVALSRLFAFRNNRRPLLAQIAPLIYKVALGCFLKESLGGTRGQGRGTFSGRPSVWGTPQGLEKALLSTLRDRTG